MEIKFSSNDDLPLNKILKLHNSPIIVESVFGEDGNYYPQVFSDKMFVWIMQTVSRLDTVLFLKKYLKLQESYFF